MRPIIPILRLSENWVGSVIAAGEWRQAHGGTEPTRRTEVLPLTFARLDHITQVTEQHKGVVLRPDFRPCPYKKIREPAKAGRVRCRGRQKLLDREQVWLVLPNQTRQAHPRIALDQPLKHTAFVVELNRHT